MKQPTKLLTGLFAVTVLGASALTTSGCAKHEEASNNAAGAVRSPSPHALDTDVVLALKAFPDAKVLASRRGVATFVRASFGRVSKRVTKTSGDASLRAVLAKLAPIFRLDASSLTLTDAARSPSDDPLGGSHPRYVQTKNGLPVIGGDLIVHIDKGGKIYAVSGTARDGENLPSTPKVAKEEAESTATSVTGANATGTTTPGMARLVYRQPTNDSMHLAWEVEVRSGDSSIDEMVYVDAVDGKIIDHYPLVDEALSRSVHTLNNAVVANGLKVPGELLRAEGQPEAADQVANANYDNLGATYACYKKLFGRDSYDNKGSKLISNVHARFAAGNGASSPNNAAWRRDVQQMFYGDGDGKSFGSLAGSFDVTVHELGHGITASEANLEYAKESGGLNEGFSDIMASVCDYDRTPSFEAAWKIGESVFTPGTAGDALRYMDDPTKDGKSFDYAPDAPPGADVHHLSGIPNLAFVLLARGGSHPRGKSAANVKGIGMQKAGLVFYRAMTTYLTATTDFMGARAATAQAAKDLYGDEVAASVNAAWDAVGVLGMPKNPAPENDPPAEGDPQGDPPAPAPNDDGEGQPPANPDDQGGGGCCNDEACFICPNREALKRCQGTTGDNSGDVVACIRECTTMVCVQECVENAGSGSTSDPSGCEPN